MNKIINVSPGFGLFLGILAVSTASIFIRFAQGQAPSLVIAAGRLVIATLLLAPFVLIRFWAEIKSIPRRKFGLLILAGLFLGLHFASWITSLEYTSVASSVVLVATSPLWVALLAPIFLKEKINKIVFFGLIVSLLGSFIVGLNSACHFSGGQVSCLSLESMFGGRLFIGNLLALAGALFSGGYLLIGRRVRNSLTLPVYTFLVYGMAAVVLIILVVLTGTSIEAYSANTWIWIVLLAIVPQLLGHSTFNYFLKTLSAAFVSIALLGEPIGTVILAYLFLHESPSLLEIGGGILILIGIFVASRANNQIPLKQE
ncbi:MAG: EamA family transporter [Chloroflexi bacterium HGW-Chloroflexi-4]|nr:MAG: EamA family transporter [Chloroflexi bacterium HGW-Chloroflexi-4]